MKTKIIMLFIGLTLALQACPGHTTQKTNKNSPKEIAQIKAQIKECYNTIYVHMDHQSCSAIRNKMYKDNPILKSGKKTYQVKN